MDSNTYQMGGSAAWADNPYALMSGDPTDNYCFEMPVPETEPSKYPSGSQLNLDVLHGWPQESGFRPPYQEGMVTGPDPDPSCLFRSGVLDDCAKARFYARALEFYLLENEHPNAKSKSCPLAACTAQFKTPKDMLLHLKHCKKFVDGKFWCPTCSRYESFRVRTGKRCSWDKDHLGRRLLKRSKSFFQVFGNNHLATQQTSTGARCPMCSTRFPNNAIPGSSDVLFSQAHPMQPTQLFIPGTGGQRQELFSREFIELPSLSSSENSPSQSLPQSGDLYIRSAELPGLSSYENSRSESLPQSGDIHIYSASAISSVSSSSNGNSLSSGISPASSTCEESPSSTRRHRAASILSKASNRVAGFYADADASDRILNQRCISLYNTVPPSYGLLDPSSSASNLNLIAPSISPPTVAQHRNSRIMPGLTIDTALDSLDSAAPASAPTSAPNIEVLQEESQSFGNCTVMGDPAASSLCTGTIETKLNGASVLGPLITSGPNSFTVQLNPPTLASPPLSASTASSQSSPTAVSPKREWRCKICNFKPKRPRTSYINKHMKRHENRIPIHCTHSDCQVTFTRRDNLKTHLRQFHLGSRKRRYGSSESLLSAPLPKKGKKETCAEELQ
ncbi:hypothetical protein F5Y09DRAFT_346704 [Xylaria sp. FL1042]|nr:hypothetical protein F5Y09DRAFT_346704 [Xylaria sp. FL1042]